MRIEDRLDGMMQAAASERRATETEWRDFVGRAHRRLYLRRTAVAASAVAVLAVGVVVSAGALTGDGNDRRPLPPAGSPTETERPERVRVPLSEQELWFVHDDRLVWSATAMGWVVEAEVDTTDPTAVRAAAWLELLLSGPMGPHQEAGDTTAIPEDTRLLGVQRTGSRLDVDLSSEFLSAKGRARRLAIAQVVYTGTQFRGIRSVRVSVDGATVASAAPGDIDPSETFERRNFEDVAPFIVLESPEPGAEISSPLTIQGFANVFEANVSIMLVDRNGDVIAEAFTTATCGNGCWGDFLEEVEFEVDRRQRGRLTVLTYSAEDGSPQNVSSIPVVLIP